MAMVQSYLFRAVRNIPTYNPRLEIQVKTKNHQRVYKLIVTWLLIAVTASSLGGCTDKIISPPANGASVLFDKSMDKLIDIFLTEKKSTRLPVMVSAYVGAGIIVNLTSDKAGVLAVEGIPGPGIKVLPHVVASTGIQLGMNQSWNFIFTPTNGKSILIVVAKATGIKK